MDEMRFDPMTGKPIVKQPEAAPVERKILGYDTMTGQPIYEDSVPGYGKKKSNGKLVAGIIAAVLAVLICFACAVVFLLGSSPKSKILKATAKTFEDYAEGDNLLATSLNLVDFGNGKEYVADVYARVDVGGESVNVDCEVNKDSSAMQLEGSVSGSLLSGLSVDGSLLFDKSSIQANTSLLDYVFVYDYKKSGKGYLSELLEEEGMSVDEINSSIQTLYDLSFGGKSSKELSADLAKEFNKVYKDIKVKKVKKAPFSIDGKEVKCAGYTMHITEDDVAALVNAYFNVYEENYGENMDEILAMAGEDSIAEMKEDLLQEIGDVDVDIRFYIYKKQLAAIQLEENEEIVSVEFLGGDYRAQNINVIADGYEEFAIESSKGKSTEALKLRAEGENVLSYTYDSETGALALEVDGTKLDGITVKNDGKTLTVKFEYEEKGYFYDTDLSVDCTISKGGAKIKKMKGKEFDLLNASEADFDAVMEDIQNLLYSFY